MMGAGVFTQHEDPWPLLILGRPGALEPGCVFA